MEKVNTVLDIEISKIFADDDFNCRGKFAPIDVIDLAKDIAKNGLVQPVTVAPLPDSSPQRREGFQYRLIAGYRRRFAHVVNKMTTINAIVRNDMVDDMRARFFNLAENIQRKDLTIMQEANALKKLMHLGISAKDVSEELGKPYPWVQVRFMLLKLPDVVQKEVDQGYISQTQIREIYTVYTKEGRDPCFNAVKRIKEAKARGLSGYSVKKKDAKKALSRKQRSRLEIYEFMNDVQESVGNSFATRCLAWAAGEVSTLELYTDLKSEAQDKGTPFSIPVWVTRA